MAKKRDYKKEYRDRTAKQRKNRVVRARARRAAGLKPGDPREVDHITPLSRGGSNGPKNTRVVSRKTNRAKGKKSKK